MKQERVIEGLENVLAPFVMCSPLKVNPVQEVNLSFVDGKPQDLILEHYKVEIITGLGKSLSQAMWAKSF